MPYNSSWIASNNWIIWNTIINDWSCTHNAAFSKRHTRQYNWFSSNPNIIGYNYGSCYIRKIESRIIVRCRKNGNSRSNRNIISKNYLDFRVKICICSEDFCRLPLQRAGGKGVSAILPPAEPRGVLTGHSFAGPLWVKSGCGKHKSKQSIKIIKSYIIRKW